MVIRRSQVADGKSVELEAFSEEEEVLEEKFDGFTHDVEDVEKDAEELELEKLVFGDSANFRENLNTFGDFNSSALEKREANLGVTEDEGALEHLEDADLFFLDSGPASLPSQALIAIPDDHSEDEAGPNRDVPAWEDSDDERLMISLAAVPRLRKLRKTEDEDLINGKEYARRLRIQYERLYPNPEWAKPQASPMRNRRRDSQADFSDSERTNSDGDMDIDQVELSVQPLARLLQGADALTRGSEIGSNKKRKLKAETLNIQRMKDISGVQPSAITSLMFHPTFPLLLSSGPSSTLYLHHIQPLPPHPNPLLTSLHVKGTPLTTTAFHPNPKDPRIFLSARKRYFHIWNLERGTIEKVSRIYGHQHEQRSMERFSLSPNGQYMGLLGSSRRGSGIINILDGFTLQWLAQARIESRGGIADFAWWSDSNGLSIAGKNGEVTEWSLKEQRTIGRWQDEGAVGTTVIAVGGKSGRDDWIGGDRWVAVGSSSGIVNIYDRRLWHGSAAKYEGNGGLAPMPKPTRVFDQLVHPTSHLGFSPDGQVLAMASRWKKDALRLIHLPSCTVFRNWPTSSTPLGRITAIAWGRGDGEQAELVLAVANEAGKIRLWEIRA